MSEITQISQKIKLSIIIVITWVVIAVAFIALFYNSFSKYSRYNEAQEKAVALTLLIAEDEFTSSKDDYKTLVKDMWRFYNQKGAFDMDVALGKFLRDEGYRCSYGSDYFKYIGFIDYTKHTASKLWIALGAIVCVVLTINLWCILDSKKSIVISNDRVLCCNGKKTVKEFFIKDIKSVELAFLKGLVIKGNSIKYRINLLKNAEDLKSTIMEMLSSLPAESIGSTGQATQQSQHIAADDLKKLKELVELGIITQEEFETKKKQLLEF